MMKKIGFILFLITILGTSLTGSNASAISPYDDAIRITQDLQLDHPSYVGSKDITNIWHKALAYGDEAISFQYNCTQAIRDSFKQALASGHLAVTQNAGGSEGKKVIAYWRNDNLGTTYFSTLGGGQSLKIGGSWNDIYTAQFFELANNQYGVVCYTSFASEYVSSEDMGGDFNFRVLFSNFPITYPSGYEGKVIPTSGTYIDSDGDGLTVEKEIIQGTSDDAIDSDGDGLDDYVESQWYIDRQDVFCKTDIAPVSCAYPNPIKKDVYVEIDWMTDGTKSYKPNTTQLSTVTNTFAAQDINIHFDTGQYGGGNEISYVQNLHFLPKEGVVDLYDIKNGTSSTPANFLSSRKDVWRYMIAGDHYQAVDEDNLPETTDHTGGALAGNDDILIAMNRVETISPTSVDTAVSGTILHELGHSLCLSNEAAYTGHDSSCVFSGIDKDVDAIDYDYVPYSSVMNYKYQLTNANYSHGPTSSTDHDDWSAIKVGINDFVGTIDPVETSSTARMSPNTRQKAPGFELLMH